MTSCASHGNLRLSGGRANHHASATGATPTAIDLVEAPLPTAWAFRGLYGAQAYAATCYAVASAVATPFDPRLSDLGQTKTPALAGVFRDGR